MTTAPPQKYPDVGTHVSKKVSKLQREYLENKSSAVAELAQLRAGVSTPIGRNIQLIAMTTEGLHDEHVPLPDEATDAEKAAYAAITLFALHQQSHRSKRMHLSGYSLGRSSRLLGKHTKREDAVRRRFNALATSTAWDEIMHHSRSLIQQFRSFDVPLDYGRFAEDLLKLHDPGRADGVRNAWGRDFYRSKSDDDDSSSDEPTTLDDSDQATTNRRLP